MSIATFDDLLATALQQPIPQRLLFLCATAELPDDASPAQRADFEAGHGGFLTPLMSVDKAPDELANFQQFVAEADQVSPHWQVVFVAALQNPHGQPIDTAMVDEALSRMTQAVHVGQLDGFIPFNRHGDAVHLQ